MSFRTVLRIGRGDITHWAADAIATSANAGLCGNRTPSYWRFQRRPDNIDGAVHAAAGPALAAALSELADARGFPYSSPTSDAVSYRGSLLPSATGGIVACPTGCAVHTQSYGLAHTRLVVHAVCPDGIFRTGPPGAAEALLRATYRSALREAGRAGAEPCRYPRPVYYGRPERPKRRTGRCWPKPQAAWGMTWRWQEPPERERESQPAEAWCRTHPAANTHRCGAMSKVRPLLPY